MNHIHKPGALLLWLLLPIPPRVGRAAGAIRGTEERVYQKPQYRTNEDGCFYLYIKKALMHIDICNRGSIIEWHPLPVLSEGANSASRTSLGVGGGGAKKLWW